METINTIPEIKRSRAYLLYSTNGKRYLDLYQDSGRAILGHRIEGITRALKSTAAKGLTASYPSIYTNRIEKQLKYLFPHVPEFRLYGNIDRAMAAISTSEGEIISQSSFIDFPENSCKYAFWRPFLNSTVEWQNFDFFIPILPFPGNFGPVVVAVNNARGDLRPSDPLSPMICDMFIKSNSVLLKLIKKNECMDFSLFESPVWVRNGPYLRFNLEAVEYSTLFKKALETLVLLPPHSGLPGIIPCVYENGQIKDFISMVKQFKL